MQRLENLSKQFAATEGYDPLDTGMKAMEVIDETKGSIYLRDISTSSLIFDLSQDLPKGRRSSRLARNISAFTSGRLKTLRRSGRSRPGDSSGKRR